MALQQLLILSQDPKNQPYFLKEEGCLNGIVTSCLSNETETVLLATRILQFLSGHPQNKKSMREFPKLVENLTQVYSEGSNLKVKEFASSTLENLGVTLTTAEVSTSNNNKKTHNKNKTDEEPVDENQKPNFQRNYRQLTIYVEDLKDFETSIIVQRVLINVPGVISVKLDKENGTASIGTREESDESFIQKLCDALNRVGVSSGRNKQLKSAVKKAEEKPYVDEDSGYLDEEDFREHGTTAVSRWGPSSLEARLELERKEEEERKARTEKILAKVGSAISSASNWLMGW